MYLGEIFPFCSIDKEEITYPIVIRALLDMLFWQEASKIDWMLTTEKTVNK